MAFTHKTQQYVYNRLLQGYCNSFKVFQAVIMEVLHGLPIMIYIDDILLVTPGLEQEHVR